MSLPTKRDLTVSEKTPLIYNKRNGRPNRSTPRYTDLGKPSESDCFHGCQTAQRLCIQELQLMHRYSKHLFKRHWFSPLMPRSLMRMMIVICDLRFRTLLESLAQSLIHSTEHRCEDCQHPGHSGVTSQISTYHTPFRAVPCGSHQQYELPHYQSGVDERLPGRPSISIEP